MARRIRKSQSILEYALLIGVVVAAILIMQVFVKRGFSGSLKESADRMSNEGFSASGTSTHQNVTMDGVQNITEETGTRAGSGPATLLEAVANRTVQGTLNNQAISLSSREGGVQSVQSSSRTDAARWEGYSIDAMPTTAVGNFSVTGLNITG